MPSPQPTVRDAVFDVLRHLGVTTIFANPGSTEVALLTDLPDDLAFVLALHENSVVGMASGHALATGLPALCLLHTTAGFGNAVGAIATARVNRAPLVVVVGQQDRRHLASEPFLAGHLHGLAGDYPVSTRTPDCAQAVPGAVMRAYHDAAAGKGPAVVIVPMGDWLEPAETAARPAAPMAVRRAREPDQGAVAALAACIDSASNPVLVAGAGADSAEGWAAVAALADRLDAPVWQEAHASRAGFPHDHVRFRGHLSPLRDEMRVQLGAHDLVMVVGGPAFRAGAYRPGPFVEPGTTVVVITDDDDTAGLSAADLVVVGDVAATTEATAGAVSRRPRREPLPARAGRSLSLDPPGSLRAEHVYAEVARRLPAESTVIEESPSTRAQLLDLMPARAPFGFLTVAMGGLGFALPAAVGIRLARPHRPVVAMVGDGASLYGIQALWSAAHYQVGALFVILRNGAYAVMDRLATAQGGKAPWPRFDEVSPATLAEGLGCEAMRLDSYDGLVAALDLVMPALAERVTPLLLDVQVSA